jgi:hypothetical protein
MNLVFFVRMVVDSACDKYSLAEFCNYDKSLLPKRSGFSARLLPLAALASLLQLANET